MRTYSGHSTAKASNELYRTNLAKGQTGLSIAFDLPTQIGYDPDSPEAAGEVGKVGVPVAHLGHMRQLLDQIPVESMNTSMTINATAAWLLGLYIANAEDRGVDPKVLSGHHAERHREGVPVAGHLHLPAPAQPAADRGHHRLHRAQRPEVEPDQRLQLPPAGGRSHAPPGGGLRPGHGHRRARRGAGLGAGPRERVPVGGRTDLLLRERRCPIRGGDVQDAGLHRPVGPGVLGALWRHRPQAAAVPLRRAGQLARAHRGPAREQRAPHRARVPRRHPVQAGPGPGPAAAGLERSPRPAPSLGPAVVAAHPADPGLRVRPARVRGHLRRFGGHREEDGRDRRGVVGRAGGRPGPGRCLRGHRRAQGPAGPQPGRAGAAHRDGRATGGRRQLLHRDGRVAAGVECRCRSWPGGGRAAGHRDHPAGRPGGGVGDAGRRGGVAGSSGRGRGPARPRPLEALGRGVGEHHAGHYRAGPCGRHDRRVGRSSAGRVRRVPGPDRGERRGRPPWDRVPVGGWPGRGPWPPGSAVRRGCWWPSPG